MSNHQIMSFEHATDRFYVFDLHIVSLLLAGCSIFSTVKKFCPVQVTRSFFYVLLVRGVSGALLAMLFIMHYC